MLLSFIWIFDCDELWSIGLPGSLSEEEQTTWVGFLGLESEFGN